MSSSSASPPAASVWASCFASIRFDLDIGPKVEYVTPPDALTAEGKQKIIQCAFPDCNPDCSHNFVFSFTMPDHSQAAEDISGETITNPSEGNTLTPLFGAAYYRQKKDTRVPRGYVQQVIVLLSRVPFVSVHELILRVVAPRFAQCCPLSPDIDRVAVSSALAPFPSVYFAMDPSYNPSHYTQEQVLDEALAEIAQWPTPHPRVRYTVSLLHQALEFVTPSHSSRPQRLQLQNAVKRPPMKLDNRTAFLDNSLLSAHGNGAMGGLGGIVSSVQDVLPLYGLLGDQLHYLTHLWELLICHEPIFILSNTPSMASASALAVASLITPIEYTGKLHSYFTVQNSEFGRMSRMGKALPFASGTGLIVAGTNPFFLRNFDGWRNLLVTVDRFTGIGAAGAAASAAAGGASAFVSSNSGGSRSRRMSLAVSPKLATARNSGTSAQQEQPQSSASPGPESAFGAHSAICSSNGIGSDDPTAITARSVLNGAVSTTGVVSPRSPAPAPHGCSGFAGNTSTRATGGVFARLSNAVFTPAASTAAAPPVTTASLPYGSSFASLGGGNMMDYYEVSPSASPIASPTRKQKPAISAPSSALSSCPPSATNARIISVPSTSSLCNHAPSSQNNTATGASGGDTENGRAMASQQLVLFPTSIHHQAHSNGGAHTHGRDGTNATATAEPREHATRNCLLEQMPSSGSHGASLVGAVNAGDLTLPPAAHRTVSQDSPSNSTRETASEGYISSVNGGDIVVDGAGPLSPEPAPLTERADGNAAVFTRPSTTASDTTRSQANYYAIAIDNADLAEDKRLYRLESSSSSSDAVDHTGRAPTACSIASSSTRAFSPCSTLTSAAAASTIAAAGPSNAGRLNHGLSIQISHENHAAALMQASVVDSLTLPLSASSGSLATGAVGSPSSTPDVFHFEREACGVGGGNSNVAAGGPGSPIFTKNDYDFLTASAKLAATKKILKSNPLNSRTKLQHSLMSYFDSSFSFTLHHDEQTAFLMKRLEAVSRMDVEAQCASVSLHVSQYYDSGTGSASMATMPAAPTTVAAAAPSATKNCGSGARAVEGGDGGKSGTSYYVAAHEHPKHHHRDPCAVSHSERLFQPPPPLSPAASSSSTPQFESADDRPYLDTIFAQYTIADDIVRKFFTSLTNEFLSPVSAWFNLLVEPISAFNLCDRAIAESMFSPASFLEFFHHKHREVAPRMWTTHYTYKGYKSVYERFANGCLFVAYVTQLVDRRLRREIENFDADVWAKKFPSEPERIDMYINLFSVVQRELTRSLDPDVVFVTTATSVLVGMAGSISDPLKDQFMIKIEDLKL